MTRALLRTLTAALVALAIVAAVRSAQAGYTHYWTWKKPPTAEKLEPCLVEMERLVEARRGNLADGEQRTGKAAAFRLQIAWSETSTLPGIAFNGIGDEAHETFAFPLAAFAGTPEFSFVKTQWKPYDEVVVACLIVARDHFPPDQLEISSDGQWTPDWVQGAQLYEQVLHRKPFDPLAKRAGDDDIDLEGAPAPPDEPGSLRRNLLISALVFGCVIVGIILVRSKER